MSNRRKIRENILQAVYAWSVGGDSPEHVLETIVKPAFKEDKKSLRFAEQLFLRCIDHRETSEELVVSHIANWELERLALVDRIILQIALTEILAFEDIPIKVSINEAIDIAKKYSTGKSGRFVNGILDAVTVTLQKDQKLQKKGRGLVDMPAKRKPAKAGSLPLSLPETSKKTGEKKKRIRRSKRNPS
ncbi:transcription antitermination factor NusB [Balneolaceae bacterium ANBcel3]|nr:transcription antitermination factor NusB [Balneolaceae bacterium ANBcel3]